MTQPLDPAVQLLLNTAASPPFTLPDPPPPAAEVALALRASANADVQPTSDFDFDGTITAVEVPVRWGSIPGRLYRHRGAGPLPAVAFFHGGGFTQGSLDSHDRLCRELATASHALILSVDYRLAPEAPFPAGLEDAYDATVWLTVTAAEFGADPTRIAVAGDSAGGNLATAVALLAKRIGSPALAFQLLFYPKLDFVNEYPSHAENRVIGIPREISRIFDDCYLPDPSQRNDPLASPALATDLKGMPPGLIVTADADTLRDEGEAYGQALRLAGVEMATLRAIGQVHGFASMAAAGPAARLITQAAGSLLGFALRSDS